MHDAFALHIHGPPELQPDEIDVSHLIAALRAMDATVKILSPDARVALIGVEDGSWTLVFRLLVGSAVMLAGSLQPAQMIAEAAVNDDHHMLAQFSAHVERQLGAAVELIPVQGDSWKTAKAVLDAEENERHLVVANTTTPLLTYAEESERVVRCVGVRTDTAAVWLDLLNGRVVRATVPKHSIEKWPVYLQDQTEIRVGLRYFWNPVTLRMTKVEVQNETPVAVERTDHVALVCAMAKAFQAAEPDAAAWLRRIREGVE